MLNSLGDVHFDPTVRNLLYGNTEHNKELKLFKIYFAETGRFWCQLYQTYVVVLHWW